jgi:hypothetical protein
VVKHRVINQKINILNVMEDRLFIVKENTKMKTETLWIHVVLVWK